MLHKKTVEGTTFELLKILMQDKVLQSFNLAGGTALSLYMGHRKSIDFDFFTTDSFDVHELAKYFFKNYDFKESYLEKNTLRGVVNGVKIDCITHDYPLIEEYYTSEGIRLYSLKDIAAMKLAAITDNGTRLKDFIDIACLSVKLPFESMMTSYEKKYPSSNAVRALKGLTYYRDINFKEPIQMCSGNYEWHAIELRIKEMIARDQYTFKNFPLAVIETEEKTIKRRFRL